MISPHIHHLIIAVCFLSCSLSATQGRAETSPDTFRPSASHRTVKEKMIFVPPEVTQRWRDVKLAVIDKTRGTENIYVIPIGSLFKVPTSALTIIVEAFLPSFKMEGTTITTSSNELENPGAKFRIYEKGIPVFEGWLFTKFPNTHAVSHPRFGFSLIGAVPAFR